MISLSITGCFGFLLFLHLYSGIVMRGLKINPSSAGNAFLKSDIEFDRAFDSVQSVVEGCYRCTLNFQLLSGKILLSELYCQHSVSSFVCKEVHVYCI